MKHLYTFCLISTFALSNVFAKQSETSSLVINEICCSNIDQWVDPSFNYGGWVELYNPTNNNISITNWYLSDDPEHLKQGRVTQSTVVKAHGYHVLWLDHYHWKTSPKTIDSKLDYDGGKIYLSNSSGILQLTAEYPEGVSRCSWARKTDGGEEWSYCSIPTPNKTNNGAKFASERLEAPIVDQESTTFSSGYITLNVQIPQGCTLRYTTDGSTPSPTNGSISALGQFTISTSRHFRFRLFSEDKLPSPVVTRTFIKTSMAIDLPILAVVGTTKNFYSDSLGIFTKGVNGRPGMGNADKCNWNMDWERPAVMSYFTSSGELLFEQEVGVERCGGWSRAWQPWSFKLKSGKEYEGEKYMEYPFFSEKPYLKHRALQIRNGGNDNGCRVRDAFIQQIVATSGLNIDYQAYQPIAHYVNGTWKGVINMREPNNKHFVQANYGWDSKNLDQFEMSPDSGYVQKCGDKVAFQQLITASKNAANDDVYKQICEMLDIDEYCNYMAVELFICNGDWPQNNLKGWRPRVDGGRWRFVLFDTDAMDWISSSFSTFAGKQTYTFDYLYDSSTRYTKEIEMVTLFLNLLNNDTFRKKFIDTFCLVTASVFEPSRCKEIINRLANRVAPTQSLYNNDSPWNTANSMISAFSSSRQTQMINQMRNYGKMKLTSKVAQEGSFQANINEARLTFNGEPILNGKFSGKFFSPLTIEASAPAGYSFTGWKQMTSNTSSLFPTNTTWKYYDKGSLDNTGWQTETYNDQSWSSGKAPLGYYTGGSRDYQTTLNYGSDANNKRPTYYFRTTFNVNEEITSNHTFVLDYKVDDGVIVYINGIEAGRYNMPSGNVYYSNYASTYAQGNPDTGSMTLDASLFRKGSNLIAVELHNNNANSTDVYWSASLSVSSPQGSTLVSTEPSYTVPVSGNVSLIACFEKDEQCQLPPVVINEISASNGIYMNDYTKKADWIELYNTTDEEIDLTGMYLSNDPADPMKFCIGSENSKVDTRISAHGYKIIWCDKDSAITQLHATFKLANDDGSQLILTSPDGTWHDEMTYCSHTEQETVGRWPDAGKKVYRFSRPTIDATNVMTSYCYSINQPNDDAIESVLFDSSSPDTYYVYDLNGRLVNTGKGPVNIPSLPKGVFIVHSKGTTFKITN